MKTIESLLKNVKKSLKMSDKIYFDSEWNVNEWTDVRLKSVKKRLEFTTMAENECIELLHEIHQHKKFIIELTKECERNVLIPKINKE